MIGALLKGGRKEDAMDLFATISANGLVLQLNSGKSHRRKVARGV
jgi:pentatricopeptide repeat protein